MSKSSIPSAKQPAQSCLGQGTATTLPTRFFAEEERAKGKSEEEIKAEIDDGYNQGRFKAPGKPGIVYMVSNDTSLLVNDKIVHAPLHLIFYAPCATDKDIGSPPPGVNMPRVLRAGTPDAYITPTSCLSKTCRASRTRAERTSSLSCNLQIAGGSLIINALFGARSALPLWPFLTSIVFNSNSHRLDLRSLLKNVSHRHSERSEESVPPRKTMKGDPSCFVPRNDG